MMVLGAGLVTADIVQLANGEWEPISDHPSYASGGTVCNILSHLARTGWHCELIGGVGNDTLGTLVLDDLGHFRVGQVQRLRLVVLHRSVIFGMGGEVALGRQPGEIGMTAILQS